MSFDIHSAVLVMVKKPKILIVIEDILCIEYKTFNLI